MAKNSRGKGWFGDTEGHARAGRKGGLARGRKNRGSNNSGTSSGQSFS